MIFVFWSIFIATIILDQLTKWWVIGACASERVVTAWLSCELSYNRGISWSMFHGDDTFTFVLVTGVIMVVIGFFAHFIYQLYKERQSLVGPALILGGAISNLIDRVFHGGVVDFIAVHYGSWAWPVFNGADIAICLGVFLLVGSSYAALD